MPIEITSDLIITVLVSLIGWQSWNVHKLCVKVAVLEEKLENILTNKELKQ